MKKRIAMVMALLLAAVSALAACGGSASSSSTAPASSSAASSAASSESTPASAPESLPGETQYYIGASWNGYLADDPGSVMSKVAGYEDLYAYSVTLADEDMDPTYGGHFYKVTNGTWDADGCWGAGQYTLQPAPAHADGAGLGSVYIPVSGALTIYFNAAANTVTDTFAAPRIYGDFNGWAAFTEDWVLLDLDFDGVYEGSHTIPAYAGEGEGWSIAVITAFADYGEYGWGAGEQYQLNGESAAMGTVSILEPADTDNTYLFSYDSATHVTTMTPV